MFNEKELQLIVHALNTAPITGIENHTMIGPIVMTCQEEAKRLAEKPKEEPVSKKKRS